MKRLDVTKTKERIYQSLYDKKGIKPPIGFVLINGKVIKESKKPNKDTKSHTEEKKESSKSDILVQSVQSVQSSTENSNNSTELWDNPEFTVFSVELCEQSEHCEHCEQRSVCKNNNTKVLFVCLKENKLQIVAEKIGLSYRGVKKIVDKLNLEGDLELEGKIGNAQTYKTTSSGKRYLLRCIKTAQEGVKRQKEVEKQQQAEQESELYWENKAVLWRDFFTNIVKTDITNAIRSGRKNVYCKFGDIIKFLPEMGEELLDNFDDEMIVCQNALKDSIDNLPKDFEFKIIGIPDSEKFSLGEIRGAHKNKLIKVPASVISLTEIQAKTTIIRYECPGCGEIYSIIQQGKWIRNIKKCKCGWTSKMKVLSSEIKDLQKLKIEEVPELLGKRTQQCSMLAILTGSLCDVNFQHNYEESKPLVFNVIVRHEPIKNKSTENVFFLEIHSVEFDNDVKDVTITAKDIKEFKEYAKNNNVTMEFIKHIAPEIVERDNEKTGMLLSIVSGGNVPRKKRDDSHVLLVGDPSLGKSTILRFLHNLYPLGRWISGKSTTGVGLIGSVIKDEQTEQMMFSKGALALANQSVVFCDELDKMDGEDRNALHEPMENQKVHIDKANKHVELSTDTTLIAAANPKYGRFDVNTSFFKQIDLPNTLISRFDLIFIMRDNPGADSDKSTVTAIMNSFKEDEAEETEDINFIRKYIYYVRRNIQPELTKECHRKFEKYYLSMRKKSQEDDAVYITARQLEGMVRLAMANAKLHLRNKVIIEDADIAIRIMKYSFESLGIESQVDIIESGVSIEESKERVIFEKLFEQFKNDKGECMIEDISSNFSSEEIFETVFQLVKDSRDFFESKPGYIMRCE